MILDNLNFLILAIFAPILVLVGLLGFIIPSHKSPTSGAVPYNIFHIAFGVKRLFKWTRVDDSLHVVIGLSAR